MKNKLITLGSIAAAVLPVSVIACSCSDKKTTTPTTNPVTPPSNPGSTIITQTQIKEEMAKITSVDASKLPKLLSLTPGTLAPLIKTLINNEISKNDLLSSQTINVYDQMEFKRVGNKTMVKISTSATPFQDIEIQNLDTDSLSDEALKSFMHLQSPVAVSAYSHAQSLKENFLIIEVECKDDIYDLYYNSGSWMYFTSQPETATIPSGTTALDYAIKHILPLLPTNEEAKIKITLDTKDPISGENLIETINLVQI